MIEREIIKVAKMVLGGRIERRLEFVNSMGVSIAWIFPLGDTDDEYWKVMRNDAKGIAKAIPVIERFNKISATKEISGRAVILARLSWRSGQVMGWADIEDRLKEKGWV